MKFKKTGDDQHGNVGKYCTKLEAENQRLVNAIHQYMQTTAQCGPKSILVENFVGMYTYMEKGDA